MKYTFINKNNNQQSIDIPEEFIQRTCRSLGCDVQEACEIYLSDEGYIEDAEVAALNEKAGANKKRKGPQRKPDLVKRALIEIIGTNVCNKPFTYEDGSVIMIKEITATNPERVLQFSLGDDTYEITLSRKRKPKA